MEEVDPLVVEDQTSVVESREAANLMLEAAAAEPIISAVMECLWAATIGGGIAVGIANGGDQTHSRAKIMTLF